MHPATFQMWGLMWDTWDAEELTALDVKRLAHPDGKRNVLFSVGGVTGLYLQVTGGDGSDIQPSPLSKLLF